MNFIFGVCIGFILGVMSMILWMVFTFDPDQKDEI